MARSQARGTGNTPADAAFIEWMELAENGGLEIIDLKEQEDDIPFPAKIRWDGDNDDDDSPWKVPPPGKRCVGRAYVRDADGDYIIDRNNVRLTRPCWKWPIRGATVCLTHGGGVARVRRSAIERMASALDAVTGAMIEIALDEDAADKDRISAINSIMDRTGVRGGVEVDIKDPGYLKVLGDMFEGFKDPEGEQEDDEPEAASRAADRGRKEGSTKAAGRSRRGVDTGE